MMGLAASSEKMIGTSPGRLVGVGMRAVHDAALSPRIVWPMPSVARHLHALALVVVFFCVQGW